MKKERVKVRIFLYFILWSLFWSFLIVILAVVNYREVYNNSLQIVKSSAIDGYNKDLVYRRWATIHGGVYVPVTDNTPPNPWLLNLPERDITTPSGKKLTLVNPAYMTRQVHELGAQQFGLRGHITSLKPLRPSNAPDDWEKRALLAFEQGVYESASLDMIQGKEYFRFMKPMITEQGCLKCHRQQGYKIGDIRGGISVSVPWEPVSKQLFVQLLFIFFTYGGIWIIGMAGAGFTMRRIHDHQKKQAKMEDALRKSEQKYRSLFNNLDQGMALHDIILNKSGEAIDYRFVEANKSFEEITGLKQADIIGKTVLEVMPGIEQAWIEKYGQVVATGKSLHYENYSSELKKHYEVVAYRPQVGQFAVIISDVTSRRLVEEQIKQKNEELAKLNTEKDKFFSIIAHDLRSPFNAFLGFTKLLDDELSTMTKENTQKIAMTMRKSASNLYNLLENLLEWSRMQQRLVPFTPEKIQLLQVVEAIKQIALEPAKIKEIELTFDIPGDISVFGDGNMLQSVIRNLVSNAIKFTPKGGRVSVSAKGTIDNGVEFSVKDTGIGMSPQMVADLFRLDVQTNRKGTENEPSSGLGLLLCKDFVEKHGGKLWVESEEEKGSTFCFTLPADPKA
ncbi:MAG: ATP-binding protein [Bacteroidota bacterium]